MATNEYAQYFPRADISCAKRNLHTSCSIKNAYNLTRMILLRVVSTFSYYFKIIYNN
jgi:hypothetical protein